MVKREVSLSKCSPLNQLALSHLELRGLEHVQVHLKEIKVMLIYKRPSNICLLF